LLNTDWVHMVMSFPATCQDQNFQHNAT